MMIKENSIRSQVYGKLMDQFANLPYKEGDSQVSIIGRNGSFFMGRYQIERLNIIEFINTDYIVDILNLNNLTTAQLHQLNLLLS